VAAHQYAEAAAEFQKILDHRGIVGADPIGALAHVQLGRAFALSGDLANSKTGIFSPFGKTLTPTSRSSRKPRWNTPSCREAWKPESSRGPGDRRESSCWKATPIRIPGLISNPAEEVTADQIRRIVTD
jgi:hypothetical protein